MNKCLIRVITKLPNSEQSYKGKVKTHKQTKSVNNRKTVKKMDRFSYREKGGISIYDFAPKIVSSMIHCHKIKIKTSSFEPPGVITSSNTQWST